MASRIPLRRTAATAAVLFVLILAFLAGRVHAGADPAQVAAPAAQVRPATPAPSAGDDAESSETDAYGIDPYGRLVPLEPQQGAVPDQGAVPSPGGQQLDPPMTHAS